MGVVEKDRRNPLFAEDKPWEVRYDNLYANVMFDRDEKIYKCWYSPFIIDKATATATEKKECDGYRLAHTETGIGAANTTPIAT